MGDNRSGDIRVAEELGVKKKLHRLLSLAIGLAHGKPDESAILTTSPVVRPSPTRGSGRSARASPSHGGCLRPLPLESSRLDEAFVGHFHDGASGRDAGPRCRELGRALFRC